MSRQQNNTNVNNSGDNPSDRKPSAIEHQASKKSNSSWRTREPFLDQLQIMLDTEMNKNNNRDAIRWREDGDGFIITDQNKLQDDLIPKYFSRPIIFQSFVRKLYRCGFRQVDSCIRGRYEFVSDDFKRIDNDNPDATSTMNAAQFSKNQISTSLPPASFNTRPISLTSQKGPQIFDTCSMPGASITNHNIGVSLDMNSAAQSITNTCINRPQQQFEETRMFEASRFSTRLCDSLEIDDIQTRLWVAKLFLVNSPSSSNQYSTQPSTRQASDGPPSQPAALDSHFILSEKYSSLFRNMIENYSSRVTSSEREGIGLQQSQELHRRYQQSHDKSRHLQNQPQQQGGFAHFVKNILGSKLRGRQAFDVPSAKKNENNRRRDQRQQPSQNASTSMASSAILLQQSIGRNVAAAMISNQYINQLIPTRKHHNPMPLELLHFSQLDSRPSYPFSTTQTNQLLLSLLDQISVLLAMRNPLHGNDDSIVNTDPNLSSRIIDHFLGQGNSAQSFQQLSNPPLPLSGYRPQSESNLQEKISALKHQIEQNEKKDNILDYIFQQKNTTSSFGQSYSSPSSPNLKARSNVPSESKLAENSYSLGNTHLQRSSRTWNDAFQSNVDPDDDDDDDDDDNVRKKQRKRSTTE